MSEDTSQLKAKALRALARREHGREELKQKLARYTEDHALLESVLDECETQGWQNEQRFIAMYVRSRSQRGYGPKKIQYELQQRGVPRSLIEEVFSTLEIDWKAQAEVVRKKKFGPALPKTWQEEAKQTQYLYQRGF